MLGGLCLHELHKMGARENAKILLGQGEINFHKLGIEDKDLA